jgi:hypothetical protein
MNKFKKLKDLISTTLDVDSRLINLQSETLSEDWASADNYSRYGSAYEETLCVYIYAVSSDFEMRELQLLSKGRNYQNANGEWSSSECATFDDIINQMNDNDLFIVVMTHYFGWQVGSEDYDETGVNVYPAPAKNEYLARIEDAEIERWQAWASSLFNS